MIAEACVPIRLDAAVIGVVNVESPVPLPAAALDELEWCARALADRIRELGGRPAESRPQRLAITPPGWPA